MRIIVLFMAAAVLEVAQTLAGVHGRQVVVVVWDGMRPDFVNQQNTPALAKLAKEGVTFAHHHSTYLSATEVNGVSISTGDYPGHDGLIGNTEYRPAIDALKPTHTETVAAVKAGDELTRGHYLRVPTLAEIVRQNGGKAVVAGSKPVALLHDRFPRESVSQGVNVFAGTTLPESLSDILKAKYGAFPKDDGKGQTKNDWTTKVLTGTLWESGVPEFSLLWLNEPDASQHGFAPGSPQSLAAIRNADENLARVLQALEAKGVRNSTDVMVVSDHGCSTVSTQSDVSKALVAAGFDAVREFDHKPKSGEILVVSNGGSCMVYVIGHERKVVRKLLAFFQDWPFTGVIFTRNGAPGTFKLSQVHLASEGAPDILLSLRWTGAKNVNGTPGMLAVDRSTYGLGQGHHGSLSAFDMHNTLIAAGPDFRSGAVSSLPSGNVDVAPTVLFLLGLKAPSPMDGRVLTEALAAGGRLPEAKQIMLKTSLNRDGHMWRQYLKLNELKGVDYFDEGNGAQEAE